MSSAPPPPPAPSASAPPSPPTPGSYPQYAPAPQFGGPTASARVKANSAVAVLTLVAGVGGIGCTFMSWLAAYGDSVNGWDSVEGLSDEGYYAAGPVVTVVLSFALALLGLILLMKSSAYTSGARVGSGVVSLVLGVALLGNVGAQFNAFDEAAKEYGIYVEAQIGMQLAGFVGLVAVVLGIVMLSVKSVIPTPAQRF